VSRGTCLACVEVVLVVTMSVFTQRTMGGFSLQDSSADPRPPLILTLAKEYSRTSFEAISPDKLSIVLWEVKSPLIFRRRGDSTLQWVDVKSGTLLSTAVVEAIDWVAFSPSRSNLIYKSGPIDGAIDEHYSIYVWNLKENVRKNCLSGTQADVMNRVIPINETEMIGLQTQGRGEPSGALLNLSIPDCRLLFKAQSDPLGRERLSHKEFAGSPDQRLVAHSLNPPYASSTTLLLRRTEDLGVVHRLNAPKGFMYEHLAFSPDSKRLLAVIANGPIGMLQFRTKILVYSVEAGELIRELDIDARRGVVMSPDQKWIATGWEEARGGREYAMVSIYDFETGKELARAELTSWRPRERKLDALYNLEFAVGGEYLVAGSEQLTRVWKISKK
jgi:WD40 repeat protein